MLKGGSAVKSLIEQTLLDNYEKYYRIAYSYMKNEHDALDVVQESAYKAMKQWKKVKQEQYIETWIYKIVVNTALNVLKKQQKHSSYEESLITEPSYEENFEQHDDLISLLATLEEKDRTVIILRFFEDLKIEQIASIIGENSNTTKSRLYRAIRKLRLNADITSCSL
ncbi:MAG: sigma-70 family RNA polymerase sigma factor [Lachnospiraceae bacterium]|nr:sigma-70 family RNA polymerase sigma factor [Lachnospiraceae bacterium]